MNTSTDRILTTHVGSLPRPDALLAANLERITNPGAGEETFAADLGTWVADVVRKQVESGIDIVNDGEFGKAMTGPTDYGPWLTYAYERLGGWEAMSEPAESPPMRDSDLFPEFYQEMWADFRSAPHNVVERVRSTAFTGPVTFRGDAVVQRDIANLRAAVSASGAQQAFVTAVAPASFGRGQNRYYKTEREFLFALADALHEEYRAIVDAGFLLQIDDPSLADDYAMTPLDVTPEEYRAAQALKIEAVNRALDGIARESVRYHVCWGSWHGPHTTDVPLSLILDMLLEVNAGALSLEAGNVRHELDWEAWEDVTVPDNLVLIPGVVSHATNLVEPAELVADRLIRYAAIVGRDRVIAGTDCGLGGRIHPELAWAKLRALSEGAKLASDRLWSQTPAQASSAMS